MSASGPSAYREERDITMAIAASAKSATEKGVPLPEVDCKSEEILPGTRGLRSSCVICVEVEAEAACVPCGHMVCCTACMVKLELNGFRCPVCRALIERVVKIYI